MIGNVDFALFHTTYLCWLLFEYACEYASLVSAIGVMPGLCTYVWGGDIKIGARFCWGMVMFVLLFSNIYDGVLVPRKKKKTSKITRLKT